MCKASPGNPWHNFISDTHRWVDGAGSTPCLNNGGIYHIASQYASIATMISNFAQTIFTTSANATFMGTPLPTIRFKQCVLPKYHTCAIIAFEYVLTKLLCDNKSFPYKAPLNPPEYLLIHTVTDCSNGTNADTSCCTSSNPCGEGEGDCPLLISTSFLKYSLELKKKNSVRTEKKISVSL